ncbi:hypothetical protein GF366_02065 [Candidatus Peregrinibacteria bacterium]|nr:hypothetical protein [Candidatus Peregrinibacteria bacterium]
MPLLASGAAPLRMSRSTLCEIHIFLLGILPQLLKRTQFYYMSELYRRLPFTRETKRPTNKTSERRMKQRLLRLQEELDRVQDKLSYQQNELTSDVAGLLEKRNTLQKEIAKIEFSLLSEEEKNKRLTELDQAIEHLDVLEEKKRQRSNYETNRQFIVARKEVQEKKRRIPAEAWHMYVTQKEKLELKNNERHLEEAAKEAIASGIAQLKRTLEGIRHVKGRLPGLIVFPETTTRPLSYAVEPLLKKVYGEHQQEMPRRVFVKTFSAHQTDKEWKMEQERNKSRTRIRNAIREKQEIIEKVKRDVKKYRPRTKEYQSASERLNRLKREKKELQDRMVKEAERIHKIEHGADLVAMNQRIKKIVSNIPDESIVVIDDLIGQGRTFRALENAFKNTGCNDVHYFTFFSSPNPLEGLPIEKERFSSGTIVKGTAGLVTEFSEEKEGQEVHPDFAYDRIVEADTAWNSLFFYGFPFRSKKEEATGVLKDQMDSSPYVVRSEKKNPALMRSVRQQYRTWGEEALENI